MGNQEHNNSYHDFQIIQSASPIKKAIHKQNKLRFQFVSLFPQNQQQIQNLQNKISLRSSKTSPYLVSLHNYWVKDEFASCGSKPRFDTFFKAATPLEQYLTYRRVKKQSFTPQEIEYIIMQVANGLSAVKEMKEEYGCVSFNNIVIDGQVKLKDPILVRQQEGWLRRFRKIQGFPSPQKLYTLFDALSSFQQHTSDLFSLGMVCLQLIYPHENLSQLYKNTNSSYLNCTIDLNQLRTYVNNIRDESLKNYINILTHEQPTKRLTIYSILNEGKVVKDNLRILKQNPYEMIQQQTNVIPNPQITQKADFPNKNPKQQQLPPMQIRQSETIPAPQGLRFVPIQPIQSIQHNNHPYRPIIQQNIPQISFKVPILQPNNNQIYTTNKIVQSSIRKLSQESSNFTPINRINDSDLNSFKSVKFDFPQMPKIQNTPYFSMNLNKEYGKSQLKMERILPKYIDNTYRTSFIPYAQYAQDSYIPNQTLPKQVASIPPPQQPLRIQQDPTQELVNKSKEKQNQEHQNQLQKPRGQQVGQQDKVNEQNKEKQQISSQSPPIQQQEETINEKQLVISSTQDKQLQKTQQKVLNSMNDIKKSNVSININEKHQEQGFVVEQYQIGTRYQGNKKDGMRNGQGEFIYKQGSRYKGNWKDNKMQGFGTLYYPSGIIAYQGQWKNDQFHGHGTVFNDNPVIIKGTYDFTNFNSLGQEWIKYQGSLKNDAKQGEGILYLTNGQYYIGNFANDFVHGEGQFKRSNGNIVKGLWNQGLLKKIIYQ